jgi:hypothetical protein
MAGYESDFAAWSEAQGNALRRRDTSAIDWANVAEEIESLGRSDRREIRSRLAIICEHLLKWRFQSEARSPSWRSSVRDNRDKIASLIEESPSLANHPGEVLAGAYASGRRAAVDETGIADLPEACPWTADQVCDPDFWPD